MDVAPELMRAVMGRFATGVAVVTGLDEGEPVGMTVQSLVSVSLRPPLILFCPSKFSSSWPRVARSDTFAVNVLHSGQEHLGTVFATSGVDKFAGARWHQGSCSGSPLLDEALAHIECEKHAIHDAGDHVVVLGRVLEIADHRASPDASPLVFYRGSFASL